MVTDRPGERANAPPQLGSRAPPLLGLTTASSRSARCTLRGQALIAYPPVSFPTSVSRPSCGLCIVQHPFATSSSSSYHSPDSQSSPIEILSPLPTMNQVTSEDLLLSVIGNQKKFFLEEHSQCNEQELRRLWTARRAEIVARLDSDAPLSTATASRWAPSNSQGFSQLASMSRAFSVCLDSLE